MIKQIKIGPDELIIIYSIWFLVLTGVYSNFTVNLFMGFENRSIIKISKFLTKSYTLMYK